MIPSILRKQRLIILALLILTITTIVIGMGLGSASLSYDRLLPILMGQGTFKEEFVLYSLRLPRIIITLLAGMALALSGAILQGITRNDLAEPGILGINSGAGVAVAIFFLYFPIDVGSFLYLLPVVGFIGAFLTAVLIYVFSYSKIKWTSAGTININRYRFCLCTIWNDDCPYFIRRSHESRLYFKMDCRKHLGRRLDLHFRNAPMVNRINSICFL